MTEMVETEHIQPVIGMEMVVTTTIAVGNRDRFAHCDRFYLVITLVFIQYEMLNDNSGRGCYYFYSYLKMSDSRYEM